MAVIEFLRLTKRFGSLVAVDEVSFEVNGGAVTGFLGPNGAGKTTTLRMLLGLVWPTAGTATIHGRAYRDLPDRLHRVGAVLEASGIHAGRTARNHLRIRAAAGRVDPRRVDTVLELVGLAHAADRRVGGFSLGMRQRLALAAALLGDPEVLILDEPANGLDPEGVRWLRGLLRGLATEGRTVLVSTHILAEVSQIADGVVILDHGRLVAQSSLQELMGGAQNGVRVRTPRPEEFRRALIAEGARVEVMPDDRLEVSGSTPDRVGTIAAELSIPVFEISSEAVDLEDMFFKLTAASTPKEAPG
jgi:ABC-2 type transport system ATP-binding protein